MSCTGIHALDPVCQAKDVSGQLANDAFSKVASEFGQAAAAGTDWLWRQLDVATSLDLSSDAVRQDLVVTGAIAGVLTVALFVIQMITVVLRREPGGIGRSLRGLIVATVGATFAIAVTRVVLAAVDDLTAGVVQVSSGANINGLGRKFALAAGLSSVSNPAIMLILSIVLLLAVGFVWAAMMARKMLIIVSAVFTPVAFSGGAADISRPWVRRWIEFTAALIAAKLVLVVILMVGLSVLDGSTAAGHGVTRSSTGLIGGALILLLGGFAPLLALRMVHFVGDSFHVVHAQSGVMQAGVHTAMALPQKAARWSSLAGMHAISSGTAISALGGASTVSQSRQSPPSSPPRAGGASDQAGNQPAEVKA